MASIGNRVRELRTRNGLSQAAFAKQIGFSRSYIGKVEQDIIQPSRKMLGAISKEFGVSVDWILTGEVPTSKIKPKYGRLREVLELACDGETREQILNMMKREEFSLLERMAWLFTILTFLDLAVEKPQYHKMLYRYAQYITEVNVGEPCQESQTLVMENLNDSDALLDLARFAFDYEQAGLFFFFYQIFEFLESWEFDIRSLKLRIKLFNQDYVTHDLLQHHVIKEPHPPDHSTKGQK